MLALPKGSLPKENRSGVIYQIPCSRCPQTYIGQTGQWLKEHQQAVRARNTSTSSLEDHVCNTGHPVDWNKAQILNSCLHTSKWCLLELWMNLKQPSTLNREHLATQPFSNCMYIHNDKLLYISLYIAQQKPTKPTSICNIMSIKERCMVYIYIWLCKLISNYMLHCKWTVNNACAGAHQCCRTTN